MIHTAWGRRVALIGTGLVLLAAKAAFADEAAPKKQPAGATKQAAAAQAEATANAPAAPAAEGAAKSSAPDGGERAPGIYAHIRTNHGEMVLALEYERTPMTVANFVLLAEGKRAFTDPKTGKQLKRPFYDGLTFHRVIDGFMIQGGDPLGNGMGGPGYRFPDEFDPALRHDKAGVLSMANAGPGTNGSQFFITLAATPWLDHRHTVFGHLVAGMDVLRAIGKVKTGPQNRPLEPVVIEKVTIERVGEAAAAWDAEAAWEAAQKTERERVEKARQANRKQLPEPKGEVDPARVPQQDAQAKADLIEARFILVRFRGARGAGAEVAYDKEEAREVAARIADLARRKGADFAELAKRLSDDPAGARAVTLQRTRSIPSLAPAFALEVGQISDPLETPFGFVVVERRKREVISCRHILIQFKGAARARTERSEAQALELAKTVRARLEAGEDFAKLAREVSDDPSAKQNGGDLGSFSRAQMVPAFAEAAFALKVGELSQPVKSPFGYHIILRYK